MNAEEARRPKAPAIDIAKARKKRDQEETRKAIKRIIEHANNLSW